MTSSHGPLRVGVGGHGRAGAVRLPRMRRAASLARPSARGVATDPVHAEAGSAREAVERYVGLIPNSTITEVTGRDGYGQTIRFTLADRPFIAFNSPIAHEFGFTPSMSIFVTCDTPDEVDELFGQLSTDGAVLMPLDDYGFSPRFGWCTDRSGVSWQIGCT